MASNDATTGAAVTLTDIRFGWSRGRDVLDIPSLAVNSGEAVFIEGPSGSGKSSLLAILAGIARPGAGTALVGDTNLARLSEAKRDAFRATHIGVIFQQFNLVPYLSILDNVLLPCRVSAGRANAAGSNAAAQRQTALDLLGRLGLADLAKAKRSVRALSVGQQQRVAAARAMIGEPALILADEPTSALDAGNRAAFIETLLTEAGRTGATVLFVSHDPSLAGHFGRRISLSDVNRAAMEAA